MNSFARKEALSTKHACSAHNARASAARALLLVLSACAASPAAEEIPSAPPLLVPPPPCGPCAGVAGIRDVLTLCPEERERWKALSECLCDPGGKGHDPGPCFTACKGPEWCGQLDSTSIYMPPSELCQHCAAAACLRQLVACEGA